jgi:predicted dehydrogenase
MNDGSMKSIAKNQKVRVGIVGVGSIAINRHLPIWLAMKKDVQIVALCDNNQVQLRKISERFKISKIYDNIDSMLIHESLDLVDICTPPLTHQPLCFKVMTAGINCIVEKPLAISVKAVDEMIQISKENDVNLFVIQNYSFVPIIRKARELVSRGDIGQILQVDVKLSMPFIGEYDIPNHWAHKLPGGLLGEEAPHACYLMVDFLGSQVNDVKAQMLKKASSYPYLFGDELKVIVATEETLGSFSISFNSPTRKIILDIIGSKQWLSIDSESQVLVKYKPITNSSKIISRGLRAASDILQRINCLLDVSFGVMIKRYSPNSEGHRCLFRQCLSTLRGQDAYPITLDKVRTQIQILEKVFSELNE